MTLETMREFSNDEEYRELESCMLMVKKYEMFSRMKKLGVSVSPKDVSARLLTEMSIMMTMIEEASKEVSNVKRAN
jgi:hypothetical protein